MQADMICSVVNDTLHACGVKESELVECGEAGAFVKKIRGR